MKTYSWSLVVFLLLSLWLIGFRAANINKNELSWDVFGYYLPLQATFIEGDPMLHEREWVDRLNEKEQFSGTVYQVTAAEDGAPMYFFLFGMSYMYAAFFAVGHVFAGFLGFAQDGVSAPYQYALVYGCILYTIIGLYYFRKVLLLYFTDKIVALSLVILVLGTNYSHHMTLKNLETVNVLFMFTAIIVWNTIQWYKEHKLRNLMMIGVSICLMGLIKPSEILILLVPVLWGIHSFASIKERIGLFWNFRRQFLITIFLCLVIAAPQMGYWYLKTGSFIYDTYNNPGVGLDITSPHLFKSLFSYRKGWLLYTPLMIFAIIGFYFLLKKNKQLFFGILFPFLVSFYIIASWTEYWYGGGFSNRPVISLYPLLFIPFGYFLTWLLEQKQWMQFSFFGVALCLVFINQFQWWQLREGILNPYRTTKEYYWKTFLARSITKKDKQLLLVNRDFTGINTLEYPETYSQKVVLQLENVSLENVKGKFEEYSFVNTYPYHTLTSKDHCWIEYSFDYKINDSVSEIIFTSLMERSKKGYGASYIHLKKEIGEWHSFQEMYLTPEIRSEKDELKFWFWNRTYSPIEVKNFKLTIYQKK